MFIPSDGKCEHCGIVSVDSQPIVVAGWYRAGESAVRARKNNRNNRVLLETKAKAVRACCCVADHLPEDDKW